MGEGGVGLRGSPKQNDIHYCCCCGCNIESHSLIPHTYGERERETDLLQLATQLLDLERQVVLLR